MSAHGREPESPLVIGTWKRQKRQRSISSFIRHTAISVLLAFWCFCAALFETSFFLFGGHEFISADYVSYPSSYMKQGLLVFE